MPSTTVTFVLDGDDVTLDSFADEMNEFNGLIRALTNELTEQDQVKWFVDGLERSSAIATIRGESHDIDAVERVVGGVLQVGRALRDSMPIPYSRAVATHARKIASKLNGEITSIRFETTDDDVTLYSPAADYVAVSSTFSSYGAVEGRIQTLSSRGGLRFTMYDTLRDKAVSCYLQEDRQETMRDFWGRRARVEGWVTRNAAGRPTTVRRIRRIALIEEVPPGSYRRARGVLPRGADDLSPEEAIRRLRDA